MTAPTPAGGPGRGRPAHLHPAALLAVAGGALLGTPARYAVSLALPTASGSFPWATLLVNLVGALILGFTLEALARRGPDTGWRVTARLAAGTGFCGAFTTYSTLAVESDLLIRAHRPALAVADGLVSVAAGLVAAGLGMALAVTLVPEATGGRPGPSAPGDPDAPGGPDRPPHGANVP